MVHFVGAGPGGPDLITLRGAELLKQADCVVYAGSLVNPALLGFVREGVPVYNSAHTWEKGMETGPKPMPAITETRRTAASTRQLRNVWAFASLQNCFIRCQAKQSGWKAWANFSTVLPVIELANTSHSLTEMMRSF